ncbi:hypothetical protein [Streptomyces sp. C8S0]|uniref:hypothetical protein n=1 Tax=Streptomyces sp. C8S0 TaxID=2585716 RepID=UPI00125D2E09|nr:hypothetical protein [Streptomyces sp. C8S0]
MRYDQSRADELDRMMLELLLPASAVESLGRWLADPGRGQRYAKGVGLTASRTRPPSGKP